LIAGSTQCCGTQAANPNTGQEQSALTALLTVLVQGLMARAGTPSPATSLFLELYFRPGSLIPFDDPRARRGYRHTGLAHVQ
jgi:hypothetical protein